MAGWHHQCNGHELAQTSGDGGLVCCGPWGHKGSDVTGPLNDNNDYRRSPKSMTYAEGWDGAWAGREAQEEGDICILMAGSCRCTAETHTT